MKLLYVFSQNLLSSEQCLFMVELRNAKLLANTLKMIKVKINKEDHGSSISKFNNKISG